MAALMTTAVGVVASAAPSYADDTVVVQGTAFPDPARANLSFVGCSDLYQRTDERLAPMVGRGPGAAPSGTRSLGFDLAGGNAVGALFTVGSVLTTSTASLAVNSVGRATGVAYAGYQEPADAGTPWLWLGRSELVSPGGAWQTVEATTRTYTWTKYDMTTHQPVLPGPGDPLSVADLAALHGGDGPGVFTIGFGCDGTAFSMDQLRVGAGGAVTTYDVEGLRTQVTIEAKGSGAPRPGDPVTLTGQLRTGTGDRVPHATMVLEQRVAGSDKWTPVLVAPVGPNGVRAEVRPEGRTFYRWRFVDRPLAEGATSMALLLDVLPPLPSESPDPSSAPPSPTPSPSPSQPSTPSPSQSPTESSSSATPSSATDSASASASASESTSDSPSSATAPPSSTQTDVTDESASPSGSDSHGTR